MIIFINFNELYTKEVDFRVTCRNALFWPEANLKKWKIKKFFFPGHSVPSRTVHKVPLGHFRSFPVIFGHVWSCPVMHGLTLLCPVMSGHIRSCPVMSGHARSCTVMYGHARSCPVMSKNSFANSNSVVRDRKSKKSTPLLYSTQSTTVYPICMLQNGCYLVDRLCLILSRVPVVDRAADFKCRGPEFESRQNTYHLSNYCS
jgi:hypothetical protein